MPSNVNIATSSQRTYLEALPVNMSISGTMMLSNSQEAKADTFYKFGEVDYVNFRPIDMEEGKFQEYIFEFTALSERASVRITSSLPVYWATPVTITPGHIYQVSIVNRIATWVEADPS